MNGSRRKKLFSLLALAGVIVSFWLGAYHGYFFWRFDRRLDPGSSREVRISALVDLYVRYAPSIPKHTLIMVMRNIGDAESAIASTSALVVAQHADQWNVVMPQAIQYIRNENSAAIEGIDHLHKNVGDGFEVELRRRLSSLEFEFYDAEREKIAQAK